MARPKDLGLEHTWRRRLRRQATSGLSIPAFCAREGVSSASFYAWRRRLAAPPRRRATRPAPVRPAPPRSLAPPGGDGTVPRLRDRAAAPRPAPLRRRPRAGMAGTARGRPRRPRAAGGDADDLAPLGRPRVPLHQIRGHAQELRRPLGPGPGMLRPGPPDGHLFLFVNRRRDRIKVLYFDHDGLAIWYKRLEAGSFQLPDAGRHDGIELRPAQLAMILSGIDLKSARQRKRFRPAGCVPERNPGKSS